MRAVLIGIRGSGKGTCASRLTPILGVPHISMGELFRKNIEDGTPVGNKAKEIYNSGDYVSDDLTWQLMKERLSEPDCKNGFILDGFPRTLQQAKDLDEMEKLDFAVFIDVSEDIVVERVSTRILCRNCGEV